MSRFPTKKILITGATGFIGQHIVRVCADTGLEVIPTGNKSNADWKDYFQYFQSDLTTPNVLDEKLIGVDCVVHSAGLAHQFKGVKDSSLFHKINAEATANVARSAVQAGVRHFILISSVSVYGANGGVNSNENSPCNPQDLYGKSKLEGERLTVEICDKSKMSLTILRPAAVYGEGDKGNVMRLLRLIEGGRFIWIGNGSNRKSLIHVEDVARACLAVIEKESEGVFNLASTPNTMREIVNGLADALGRKPSRLGVPSFLVKPALKITPDAFGLARIKSTVEKWLSDDTFDGSEFQRVFDFQPNVTLRDGLKRQVEWAKKNNEK